MFSLKCLFLFDASSSDSILQTTQLPSRKIHLENIAESIILISLKLFREGKFFQVLAKKALKLFIFQMTMLLPLNRKMQKGVSAEEILRGNYPFFKGLAKKFSFQKRNLFNILKRKKKLFIPFVFT